MKGPQIVPQTLPDPRDGGVLPWRKTTCQGQFETCLLDRDRPKGAQCPMGPEKKEKKTNNYRDFFHHYLLILLFHLNVIYTCWTANIHRVPRVFTCFEKSGVVHTWVTTSTKIKRKSNLLNGPRARQTPRIMAGFIHKALIFFSPVVSGIRYGYLLITAVHSWHSETPLDGNYTTDLLLTWMNYFMSPNRSWAEKEKRKRRAPSQPPSRFPPKAYHILKHFSL